MLEHYHQLWPAIPLDEEAKNKLETELVARTKEYLSRMSSHTEIKEAITYIREKSLTLYLLEQHQQNVSTTGGVEIDDEDESEFDTPYEDEDTIEPVTFEVSMFINCRETEPAEIKNEVVKYRKDIVTHSFEVDPAAVMEIIETLSDEARYTLAHRLTMNYIAEEGPSYYLWTKEAEEAELDSDSLETAQEMARENLVEEEDLEDIEEDLRPQDHYVYEQLKQMHFKILGPQNSEK